MTVDPRTIFGEAVADDPYDGLPAHMVESIPLTVKVTIERPGKRETVVGGERKIMLDARPHTEEIVVQLERDGRPLTRGDVIPGWRPGEREGWKAWPVPPERQPPGDTIDIDAEECE